MTEKCCSLLCAPFSSRGQYSHFNRCRLTTVPQYVRYTNWPKVLEYSCPVLLQKKLISLHRALTSTSSNTSGINQAVGLIAQHQKNLHRTVEAVIGAQMCEISGCLHTFAVNFKFIFIIFWILYIFMYNLYKNTRM